MPKWSYRLVHRGLWWKHEFRLPAPGTYGRPDITVGMAELMSGLPARGCSRLARMPIG